ncbi:MAG TPA: winged helix DNA-binding domain-containing protein [Ktedonobacterales bacterium]
MATAAIGLRRLAQQRLAGQAFATPAAAVAWLGAVQAQDYPGALWSLGMRLHEGTTAGDIERAFDAGTILRTHVLRPTWHFVTPADIRWLLALTAPRVLAASAYSMRRAELDDALCARSNAIIAAEVRGGHHRTRTELATALEREGIAATGLRLTYLVMRAELDAVICSGPRHGKQFTYALLDERAPHTKTPGRDEALAELTQRYFTGHGPATVRDFVWWSGLTVADAKAGLALVGSALAHEERDGQTYWFAAAALPAADPAHAPLLLPTYDELLVGYSAFDATRRGERGASAPQVFDPTIILGGQVVGGWKRTLQRGSVVIERAPFAPLAPAADAAITAAANRYGRFLGLPVVLA